MMRPTCIQPCASCGCEPEEFRIIAGLGLRCATPHCPVHPAVTARTLAHAQTAWNLSQRRPHEKAFDATAEPAADAIRAATPSLGRLQKIDDVRRIVTACEGEFTTEEEQERLNEALLQAVVTLFGAPAVRDFIGS